MRHLKVSEAAALLEPMLTTAIASYGYTIIGLKSEPNTYVKPIGEDLSNVARFQINGWGTPELYLTIVIGVNESRVAQRFIQAAALGGVSYRTLELCGGSQLRKQTDQGKETLWHWPITLNGNLRAIAEEAVEVAVGRTQTDLAKCQTMQGLYETLKHYQDYPNIRNFDDKQMMLLIPIVEYAMGKIETARQTIAENIATLQQAQWKSDHGVEDYISKLEYITKS